MGIPSVGPAGPDPFTPTTGPAPEEIRDVAPVEVAEKAPLSEGVGIVVDTSA